MKNNQYILSDKIKYRREGFGGIIYDITTKETRFYNHAAALSIELFNTPNSLEDVINKSSKVFKVENSLNPFLHDLVNRKILILMFFLQCYMDYGIPC